MHMRGLRLTPAILAAIWVLGQAVAPAAQLPDYSIVRQQFLQAMASSAPASDADDDPALRAYPLYPYLQAERIRKALSVEPTAAAADRRAEGFLATYGTLPVGAQLRRNWLESLAQREQWATFLDVFREAGATDALRCQSFTAKIATGQTAQLGPALVRQWLTTHEVPECERPYAWGAEHGIITPDLVERRARLALQAGNSALAKSLIVRLPESQAPPLRLWAALLDNPQHSIDALLNEPTATVVPEALLAGWTRLARQDPDAAVERYAPLLRAR